MKSALFYTEMVNLFQEEISDHNLELNKTESEVEAIKLLEGFRINIHIVRKMYSWYTLSIHGYCYSGQPNMRR